MTKLASLTAGVLMLLLAPATQAATVTDAGSVKNQPNWDTQGYGDVGYVFFATNGNTTDLAGGQLAGGYIARTQNTTGVSHSGVADTDAWVELENPGGVGTFDAGIRMSTGLLDDSLVTHSTYTFGLGTPSSLRIGLLVAAYEIADATPDPLDVPQQISVAGANTVTAAPAVPSGVQADWYFFDLTNITAGDSIIVSASRIADLSAHRFNPISGVVFSSIPSIDIPTPAGLTAGLAMVAVVTARRCRP